ncbi:MAG: hypothetical protein OXB86_00070 [Bdellovibrionales bacterium]|nr:hypothetical protein [Bdellovibrionales bacterium]
MVPIRYKKKQQATTESALKRSHFVKIGMKQRQRGFIILILLPLIMTLVAGLSGLTLMSLGIKNLTRTQSICITENIHGQKQLGKLLSRLLKINKTVTRLHRTKQALQTALIGAIGLGQIQLISALKKQISFVKKYQKYISLQQKHILIKSELSRKRTFIKIMTKLKILKTKNIQEEKVFKKALAVSKKTLGPNAYTYQPLPDFSTQQMITFSWKINPFLQKNLKNWLPDHLQKMSYIKRQCAATLKKQKGQWTAQLTH